MDRLTNIGSNGEIWITDNDETRRFGRKESAYKKLAEYEDLEEQGLLFRLPCKVGDTVWDNDFGRTVGFEVTGFSFGDMNEDYCDDEVKVFNQIIVYHKNSNGSITGSFAVSEIGKNVFLTQEEAEQKLKEMESD